MRRRRWLFVALLGASACASLDGLTGGAGDAGPAPPEAGTTDSAATDSANTTDVTDRDVATKTDADAAIVDASVDADAEVLAFCKRSFDAAKVLLCSEFDNPIDLAEGFSSQSDAQAGTGYAADAGGVLFTIDSGAEKPADVFLSTSLQADAASETATFSVSARITASPPIFVSGQAHMMGITVPDGNEAVEMAMALSTVGVVVVERSTSGNSSSVTIGPFVPAGERWELAISHRAGDFWNIRVLRNDSEVYNKPSVLLASGTGSKAPSIHVGAYRMFGTDVAITYDDLLVTVPKL